MLTEFEYDCLERKRLARQARYRKRGSKSKKCPMSTDYMTQKEWKERNGEVITMNLNRPVSWSVFKALPISMQEEYMGHMVSTYNANATSFAEMFGVQPPTVRRHIQSQNLRIKFPVGHSMTSSQKEAWAELLANSEDDAAPNEDIGTTMCEEPPAEKMRMKSFSLCFSGAIDVNAIANSLLHIVGNDATGEVEIMCNLE